MCPIPSRPAPWPPLENKDPSLPLLCSEDVNRGWGPLRKIVWGSPYCDPGTREGEEETGERRRWTLERGREDAERQRQRETHRQTSGRWKEAAVSSAPGSVPAEKLGGEPASQAQKEKGRESCGCCEQDPARASSTATDHWSPARALPTPRRRLPPLPALPGLGFPGHCTGAVFPGSAVSLSSGRQCCPSSSGKVGDTEPALQELQARSPSRHAEFLSKLTPASKLPPPDGTSQALPPPQFISPP